MNTLEQLSNLPFINKELLPRSVNINQNNIQFKFPIQHRLDLLQSIGTITQNIPKFESKNPPHDQIKNIIAIASGKGGVGKSTVTYYLALALQHMGAKVGVLDADIYGPSQSLLFNLDTKPIVNEKKQFIPYERHGIQVMSIGSLDASKAIMWRGPMISQALTQLYNQTNWKDLDYLLIDLPPGTGDIPLTLIQKMPLTAALLISQAHPLAALDVDKSEKMFKHLGTPILGTVMNQANASNLDNSLNIPHHMDFQSMQPLAHPDFINLAEKITQRLAQYSVRSPNPFDTISVTTVGK
jgi:Mrp family chromosome partitioning ATPase